MRPKCAFRPALDHSLEGRQVPSGLAHPAAIAHHEVALARNTSGHAKPAIHPTLTARATAGAASTPAATRILSSAGFVFRPAAVGIRTTHPTATPSVGTAGVSTPSVGFPGAFNNGTAGTFIGTTPNTLGSSLGTSVNANPMTFTSTSTPLNGGFNFTTAGTFIGANNTIGFEGGLSTQASLAPSLAGSFVSSSIGPVSGNTTALPFSPIVTPAIGLPFAP